MPVGGGKGGGGSAADVRAGGAFVELFARDRITAVLDKIKSRAQAFAGFMSKIGTAATAAGAGIAAPLTALLKSGIDRADKIGDIGEVFGLTAESASRMASAWEIAGGSLEEMEMAFSKLAAANKTGRPLDEFLLDVADALDAIDDPSEKFRAAQEVFGARFARAFIDTGGDIRGLLARGQAISPEEIRNAKEFKKASEEISIALKSALLPALQFIAPMMKQFALFVRENASLLLTLASAATGLAAFGGAMIAAGAAVSGTLAAVGLLKAGLLLLVSPIGLATAAVVGLGALILTQTKEGADAIDFLKTAFSSLGQIFGETWAGVVSAVKAGDLELAFKIVGVGIQAVWAQVMLSLRKGWNDFMVWTVESLRKNPWILPLIGGIVGGLVGGPKGALAGAGAGAAGALGLEFFADEIKRALMADTTAAAAKLARLRGELTTLTTQAAAAASAATDDQKYLMGSAGGGAAGAAAGMAYAFSQIKGAFEAIGARQFGYGDTREKEKELTFLEKIAEGKGGLPGKIGDEVVNALRLF